MSHFRRFVDGEVREFTIVELKEMILKVIENFNDRSPNVIFLCKTYPDRGANACFDMAANLVDDFSNREGKIEGISRIMMF